jgi:hypothetical protein
MKLNTVNPLFQKIDFSFLRNVYALNVLSCDLLLISNPFFIHIFMFPYFSENAKKGKKVVYITLKRRISL